jgi:hypothetical protein
MDEELLPIGQFATLGRLSIKQLRHYAHLAHLAEHPMNDAEREAFMLRHDTYWL